MVEAKRIIDALAIGVPVIAAEHFFSTFLSSPLTVETLYSQNEEQRRTTLMYLTESIVISMVFAGIIGYYLKDNLAIISGAAVCTLYAIIYLDALDYIDLSPIRKIFGL